MNDPARAQLSAGARFRAAIEAEKPLQVVGAINAYVARMAEATGFRALYLSGGGVAANSLGLPDLGISTMDDVLIDIRRITEASTLPLLVDADTGWGGAFNIARTVKSFTKAGAAGMHIEDQVQSKRCGHRPGKEVVPRAGDGRSRQGRGGCAHGSELRDHGAQRCAGQRRPRAHHRAPRGMRGRGRGRHLPRGHHRPADVSQGARRRRRAGAGQHHRVRQDAAIYARGTGRRRRGHRAALLLGLPRHEPGGARGVPGHSPRRHAEERASAACRRATTSTGSSTTTPTSRSSTQLFLAEKEKK